MNVLVVAAHMDDEVLGCGGAIARHVADGDTVKVVYMADGVSSRDENEKSMLAARLRAAKEAQKTLGVSEAFSLGFPDNKMDSLALLDVVKPLEKVICKTEPEIVYTHHHGDLNVDHRITLQAALTACRPLPGTTVRKIYSFEVLSSTEWSIPGNDNIFNPCRFVDISKYLELKFKALKCYQEEMRSFPHPRSYEMVEYLARFRGGSIGLPAAEAFEIVRECVM